VCGIRTEQIAYSVTSIVTKLPGAGIATNNKTHPVFSISVLHEHQINKTKCPTFVPPHRPEFPRALRRGSYHTMPSSDVHSESFRRDNLGGGETTNLQLVPSPESLASSTLRLHRSPLLLNLGSFLSPRSRSHLDSVIRHRPGLRFPLLETKETPEKKIVYLPVSPFRLHRSLLVPSFLLVHAHTWTVSSDIDPDFKALCLNFHGGDIPSPISSASTDSNAGRLTKDYPQAYSDFYPSKAGCVYKSGPAWQVRTGPEQQGIVREVRPVHRPDLATTWVSILEQIIKCLDALGVNFTCINPLGWANKGEKESFCPFLLSVGVTPGSLPFKAAVAAAGSIKEILTASGLAEVEVAFVEMVNKRSTNGPKLLPFDPTTHDVLEFRKPFSATLGISISPRHIPYFEGTGGLFFRLSSDSNDERIALLTCAHVIRPPPAFPTSTGMTRTSARQPKEYVIAPGSGGYDRAVTDMMTEVAYLTYNVEVWNRQLDHQPATNTVKSQELTNEVNSAKRKIHSLNELHTKVTKSRSTAGLRTIGGTSLLGHQGLGWAPQLHRGLGLC